MPAPVRTKTQPVLSGESPVQWLPGVGPRGAELLARLGIERVADLWFHLPLRYEDRTRIEPIAALDAGVKAQVLGRVLAVERGFRFRPFLRVALGDDSGATLLLRFIHFNQAQARGFEVGQRLLCFGEPRRGQLGFEMVHPSYRRLDDGAAVPVDECLRAVYPVTEGLDSRRLAAWVAAALRLLPDDGALELVPASMLKRLKLPGLAAALRYVHAPPPSVRIEDIEAGRHPSQRRLIVEELLAHHLALRRRRLSQQAQRAPQLSATGELAARLRAGLPFALTGAQQRVVAEVGADLAKPAPMLRLVQGDVGSGKTIVAALAAAQAIEAGCQVAVMAPTELLAEQHRRNFAHWFACLGIEPVWLASKVKGRARAQALAAIADGAPLVVGTHALMQEGVGFARLGLAIIDEQHRFGVHQRLALRDKGAGLVPHQLVMTATPIPRTLAMAAYADLDVSVIDELPPGRTPVTTVAVPAARRDEVVTRIHAACAEGRQAYWVCTLIEESELLAAQAAEQVHAQLTAAVPDLRVGLIHGRLKPAEKETVMAAFKDGHLHVLVATTVIEVGVDVPNASLMVIENAERLGLAQLHQLRGRVGRGRAESSCVLLYEPPLSGLARERLDVLRHSNDGFRIAEKDLELRGPGELLGTRQTGVLGFRIADLSRDGHELPAVAALADEMLADYPDHAERLTRRWIGQAERYAGA
ncbi:ATP-dependent DNA helicase RecG [Pseudofulvimonas gallinarii]|uniref:ATP-dependent DNA helicase RecG n=1 Tax=Pseudofulvimonas gallinarii TaxID=634155 RepID=A0A4R3L855_9GAMM|nr:ATP-dependent DNA helicase RecG [Pseudofulvimonas gallinarii]TCS93686.1 ATP-dependent DNA helicase RecG [Pseudofulvimonas gallinarii]THD14230.1 ATP-dependent DNA helicase RecG [Pseudofulvimonas gallinarii]